jgi:hypothetical protein
MATGADPHFRVKITNAYHKIQRVKISPAVAVARELALQKGPAICPI